MKEHNWSYLAGLIDGEGCFAAWRYWNANRTNCKPYWQYSCRATITNTNLQLMKWLVEHFGGSYYIKREATDKHKCRMEWRPKGKANLKTLLLSTLPYLVIKREQAKLLLEWVDLGYDTHDRRAEIVLQLNALNQKGTVETDTLNGVEPPMIQSDLTGDSESAPVETQESFYTKWSKVITAL